MTQEEKAKAYDEALDKIDDAVEAGTIEQGFAEWLFPELKESEDERIREEILDCFISIKRQGCFPSKYKEKYDSWVGWLEKQKEQKCEWSLQDEKQLENIFISIRLNNALSNNKQDELICWLQQYRPHIRKENKSADKVEPKFHEGDWVVQEGIGVYKVVEVCESWYEVIDFEDNHYSISFDKEYMCRLWTIEDAKDGDVLASKETSNILIFKKLDTNITFSSYYDMTGIENPRWCNQNFIPATKEQRNLLFSKMREEGYEWDAEKK